MAQLFGPLASAQLNTDFFVGSNLYATIQSAVTAAASVSAGARVIIPFGVTPSDTIANASGAASIPIIDQRPGIAVVYSWNGSAYVVQYPTSLTTTGTVTAAGGSFSAPVLLPTGTPTGQQAVSASYLNAQLAANGSLPTATAANQFLVSTGATNSYTARTITAADLPATITSNTSGSAATLSQTLAIASGGTGATTAAGALTSLGALSSTGGAISGTYTGAPTFSGPVVFSGNPTFSGTANFTGAKPITFNGSALAGQAPIVSSATPVFDGTNGLLITMTLNANVTSSTVANLIPGLIYTLEVVQAATGSGPFSMTYPTASYGSWAPVSPNAGQRTTHLIQVGSNGNLRILVDGFYE